MKYNRIILSCIAAMVALSTMAVVPSPKRDFRGAWLSTVWAIDWPAHRDTTAEAVKSQKLELRKILDNYTDCNINACFFQVRGMCDAMYQSKYEPWSQFLTGKRGLAPTYDPLEYVIEQAHAQGIEVHAWINPYRYATSSDTYGTLPTDYSVVNPGWIIKCGDIFILNPGEPAVRKRIVDVVCDIIDHYDVDGIVFDDYFYQDGMKDEYDDRLYALYNPDSLSRADWRRAQVNLMVAEVNAAIKARKPWCRFGIGPAGVAASSKAVADKYGITPCPAGSDWQYNQIYAEPVQWYVEHSVDYITPQVYWTIGSANDYSKIAPWWYMVANTFGRHCYISQSLTNLSPTRNMPVGMTERERIAADAKSTNFYAGEIVNQILIDYASTRENAPGSVFWSTKQIAKSGFTRIVTRDAYTRKAIVPNLTWFAPSEEQGFVTDLVRNGQTLTWQYAVPGQRFGIYAMPHSKRHDVQALTSSLYYQGLTYGQSFTLPDSITADFDVCVSVIDRYGNEYAPRFLGEALGEPVSPRLLYPLHGDSILLPSWLEWESVEDAMGYQVQLAYDSTFEDIIATVPTDTNAFFTQSLHQLDGKDMLYWRVRALVPNRQSLYSETRAFHGHLFACLSPLDGASGVELEPTIRWEKVFDDAEYYVEIATSLTFDNSALVYVASTHQTEMLIPENTLTYGTNYYVRVTASTSSLSVTSAISMFTTKDVVMTPPVILAPLAASHVYGDSVLVSWQDTPNNGFRVEYAKSPSFPPRSKKVILVDRGVLQCYLSNLTEGVWYLRIATRQVDESYTDYSDVIDFTYTLSTRLDDAAVSDEDAPYYDLLGRRIGEERVGQLLLIRSGKLIYQPQK